MLPAAPAVGQVWEPKPNITDTSGASQELLAGPRALGDLDAVRQHARPADLGAVGRPGRRAPGEPPLPRARPRTTRSARSRFPGRPGGAKVPVTFEATAGEPPLIGRLLGTETRAYLGRIAATPVGERERVPLAEACGRYLDWYEADPPADPVAAGVEAPEVQEPQEDGRDE